ncbi:MAG: PAS domain-containing protein [Bacteroidetes bacterium]|nr:PAS domain-containing protein [Bacteroidota bacterium]
MKINEAENHIAVIAGLIAVDQSELSVSSKMQNVIMMIIGFIVAVAIAFFLSNYLVSNVHRLKDVIESMRHGVLPEKMEINSNDEIAEIIDSVNHLAEGLQSTSTFAGEIGKGNFNMEFKPLSDRDILGNSLLNMRSSLVKVAEEERKRNWATEGMAKFGDILRANGESLDKLADNIIGNLVKYLGANQGGLFIVNDSNPADKHLNLIACYAWNKKKYINMRVEQGEGLVGQAWQENDMLYITDVPEEFVRITSGLGDANPNCFLIVPLTVNDETFGVIEMASFHLFEDYQKDFVKKIAESIASTLSTAKVNERTKVLLEQSQQQTEEMRAQEEEMRQNMEEMQATQEEMERKEGEMKKVMDEMHQHEEEIRQNLEEMKATQEEMTRVQMEMRAQNNIIDSVAIVSKTDLKGNITCVNDQFVKWAKYTPEEVMGKNHRILRHEDMPAEAFVDLWKTISSRKIWRGEVKNKAKDGSFYWVDAIIAPILDDSGKPKEYIAQRFVINEKKEQEELIKKLTEELKAKK